MSEYCRSMSLDRNHIMFLYTLTDYLGLHSNDNVGFTASFNCLNWKPCNHFCSGIPIKTSQLECWCGSEKKVIVHTCIHVVWYPVCDVNYLQSVLFYRASILKLSKVVENSTALT